MDLLVELLVELVAPLLVLCCSWWVYWEGKSTLGGASAPNPHLN